ncbi:uncharacterized protein STEHIDRAFT_55479 [Stereum hirsutum FP-91666 SS1]|uniref:uncharacterized protein n=1 Tax=Stereum hirsutum (strain FP-91666) TaxID=721885 RepID=UPI000440A389|nr:uncharacterized protein STEHIDRAFT_55479 [Stereum hirsutum FP-91666 SS1]EIM88490.1 hypothetical protein STEHIDRAFT_55479 [Stereum hirsutum FP-91666 SS1]
MPPPNSYYPEGPNDVNGGLPINLDSLRDGPPGSKPFYPYSTLIRYAIKGSPNQKLLLEDIYYAIESRFPYFRSAPSGWKNSVRHNLSLNPCFEKVARPLTDRGKGSYWTVNDNVDPRTGVHRIRKKKPKSSSNGGGGGSGGGGGGGGQRGRGSQDDVDEYAPDGVPSYDDPHAQYVPPPPPPPMETDETGQPRPAAYPPPYPPYVYSFDPTGGFAMMPPPPHSIRFMPPPLNLHLEDLDMDENGNVDWHMAWINEIQQLQHITAEQEKAGADQEWFRMMFFRVRSAMMVPPPFPPGDPAMAPPPGEMHHPSAGVGGQAVQGANGVSEEG